MREIKLFSLANVLFLIITLSLSAAVSAATPRANDLVLRLGNKNDRLLNVTLNVKYHVETQPQTFESISTQIMEGNKAKITVNVGRKGSSSVADTYNHWLNDLGIKRFGKTPGKLNFAVKGDLKFTLERDERILTGVIKDFVIAQGHTVAANDWWIAIPNCKPHPSDPSLLLCNCDDIFERMEFKRQTNHPDEISIIPYD